MLAQWFEFEYRDVARGVVSTAKKIELRGGRMLAGHSDT
jgi:hypothetical protein